MKLFEPGRAGYADKEGFPRSVSGEVYHYVRTAEFHCPGEGRVIAFGAARMLQCRLWPDPRRKVQVSKLTQIALIKKVYARILIAANMAAY